MPRYSEQESGPSPNNFVCAGLFGRMKNAMFYGRKWRHREESEKTIHEYVGSYNDRRIVVK
ncbi:IS3 family transposase [Corynebacterium marquesiae]|uniref:IS3 family transposase n=1 Tax=Corynebacterium marquesiae TaxID=2913503 RepID=UPI003D742799